MDGDKVISAVPRSSGLKWWRRAGADAGPDEKLKIILESLQAPRQVAATAR
jgi:hypothetical protein